MTEELENIPAFPCAAFGPSDDLIHQTGMTIRDWFAGMALQGIMSDPDFNSDFEYPNPEFGKPNIIVRDTMAERCYRMADAMMKARGE